MITTAAASAYDDPAIPVTTSWGLLTLTFHDPADTEVPPRADGYGAHKGRVCSLTGNVTINRIPVSVLESYCLRDDAGAFTQAIGWCHSRRSDMHRSDDLPQGVLRVLWLDLLELAQTAYAAHPDLHRAAIRARLMRATTDTEQKRDRLRGELAQAVDAHSAAVRALDAFDAGRGA